MDYLSRIGIFIEVAKQESFAGAARELGITSSAVSKQIQNLEYELRTKLLNRTTRKVSLTEEGALFFDRASRAMEDLAEAREQINELKATPRGLLRISVPMSLGSTYLKEPIAQFAKLYPEVTLDVSFDDRIINMVEEGFDLVVRLGTLEDSSLIARRLLPTPVCLYASPEYLKKHGTPHTPEELSKHNVLAYTRNKGTHEWRYRAPNGTEGVVTLQSTFKCDAASMMIEAARESIGIIIAPNILLQDAADDGCLVRILEKYTSLPERNLYVVFQANRFLSTRLRLFVEHLDNYCKHTFGR